MGGVVVPPVEYDREFPGRIIREDLPYWDIAKASGVTGRKGRIEAYSRVFQDSLNPAAQACKIVVPVVGTGGTKAEQIADLLRHEIGHCNGWPADHKGGR